MASKTKRANPSRSKVKVSAGTLEAEEVAALDRWFRAANYLSVGQIYLLDNPLLRRPLRASDIKPRLPGHPRIPPAPGQFPPGFVQGVPLADQGFA